METVLKSNHFFKVLFDAIPAMALVVDSEGRLHALNDAAKNLFRVDDKEVYLKKGGEVFKCVNTNLDPRGCGYSSLCEECEVRNTAMAAINGQIITRAKGKLEIRSEEKIELMNLFISSSPLEYEGIKYAIVIIEDVSDIVELEGLLPICSSCKKIRNEKGYWDHVEKYIEKHSEAEFTHGLCPDCIEKLYPSYADKINNRKIV